MEGSDGIFTFNPGVDGLVGSSDDIRGDDVNLNWFLKSTNNPFTIAGTIDSSTYTRNLIDLPTGHLYSANADRSVAASLGFSNTEAVMQQGSYSDEAQRTLSADDAATLRYAMSGLDEIQGTADDYTFTLVYAGMVSAGGADIVFDFDSSKTGFATCYFSGSFINSSHITTIGADIYFDDSYNWFFNDELAVSGCGPPASGDWIITQDCTLEENSVADANVIVQENVVLTIASGISLDIDFLTHHLKVKNGAKVVIQQDGKIF
jgi:hypothetical protein